MVILSLCYDICKCWQWQRGADSDEEIHSAHDEGEIQSAEDPWQKRKVSCFGKSQRGFGTAALQPLEQCEPQEAV